MLKRLCLAFAGFFALASVAQGAGTVPGFSLVPQFDLTGKIMPGCRLYVIQAGTVSTPQNAYQDSGLTLLQPNPMLCDASGRLGQWFVADGNIKLRLTDKNGVQIFAQDGLLVVGASSGGGGGSPIDPTTIAATGDMKTAYGTSVLTGWVRANGRTIGSATSGATERANADCQSLFIYLWGADANLAVSGGRGASGAADWAANKTITLPDARGRMFAGLDDMGNSPAGNLTSGFFASPTTLGAVGGSQSRTLTTLNLPPYTPAGTITNGAITMSPATVSSPGSTYFSGGGAGAVNGGSANTASQAASTFTGTAQGGTSSAFGILPPMMLATIYLKL